MLPGRKGTWTNTDKIVHAVAELVGEKLQENSERDRGISRRSERAVRACGPLEALVCRQTPKGFDMKWRKIAHILARFGVFVSVEMSTGHGDPLGHTRVKPCRRHGTRTAQAAAARGTNKHREGDDGQEHVSSNSVARPGGPERLACRQVRRVVPSRIGVSLTEWRTPSSPAGVCYE